MFGKVLAIAFMFFVALGSLTIATAEEAKEARGKQIALDLGGGVKLDLVSIPAGSFTLGDASYKSAHKVTITKSFHLGKYEVTQEQWKAEFRKNSSSPVVG